MGLWGSALAKLNVGKSRSGGASYRVLWFYGIMRFCWEMRSRFVVLWNYAGLLGSAIASGIICLVVNFDHYPVQYTYNTHSNQF